ncbi:MAG: hypothetical protein ACR2KK_22270 [Acidimicrobiales bacterium]
MKKRLTVAMLAMTLVATACGGGGGDDAAPDTQATTPTTSAPVRGGTLVMAINSDPVNLNPAVTSQGGVHTSAEPLFNGLVGWGTDGKSPRSSPSAGRSRATGRCTGSPSARA